MLRALIAVLTAAYLLAGDTPATLPGIWLECESGSGHVRMQVFRQASGGRIVGWITADSTTVLQAKVPQAMTRAVVFLRYNQAGDGAARLSVRRLDGAEVAAGRLPQPNTGGWSSFAWSRLELGPLAAGDYELRLSGDPGGTGGHDVLVLMDDRWDGLYLPPEHFSNGKPVDNGTILPPLALDARPDRADAVFASELPVRWVLSTRNRTSQPQSDDIAWTVTDAAGRKRSSDHFVVTVPSRGENIATITVASRLPNGWYRLDCTAPTGIRLSRWFSCTGGATTTSSPAKPAPWLGMNIGYAGGLGDIGEIRSIASDFTAVGIGIARCGGNKGDPSQYDAHIAELITARLEPHWVINYRGEQLDVRGSDIAKIAKLAIDGPEMADWMERYKQRCLIIMRHFSSPGAERVRHYICGNEPDLKDASTGLPGRPDIAVLLCRAMFEAARETNPAIIVESGPVSAPHSGYLRTMIVDHGLAGVCDVIGTHVYGAQVLDHGVNKPWEFLAEAGVRHAVACSESGVTTGWAKGTEGRQWQTDYLALHRAKLHRMGYQYGILFTHDEDHSPDWALMRVGGERLQPAWDFLAKVMSKPTRFRNGGFEEPNDVRSGWVPDRNIDVPGWMEKQFTWQATDQAAEGASALRIDQGSWKWDIAAMQVVDDGIVPGQPVTIRGQIRTTGHAPARLSVCGFDRLAGSETVSRPVTATEWTQVEITVTPSNPWIVVLVGASPALGKPAFAWFDAITVEAAQAQGSR